MRGERPDLGREECDNQRAAEGVTPVRAPRHGRCVQRVATVGERLVHVLRIQATRAETRYDLLELGRVTGPVCENGRPRHRLAVEYVTSVTPGVTCHVSTMAQVQLHCQPPGDSAATAAGDPRVLTPTDKRLRAFVHPGWDRASDRYPQLGEQASRDLGQPGDALRSRVMSQLMRRRAPRSSGQRRSVEGQSSYEYCNRTITSPEGAVSRACMPRAKPARSSTRWAAEF